MANVGEERERESAGSFIRTQALASQRLCLRIGGVSVAIHGLSVNVLRCSSEIHLFRTAECDADLEVALSWAEELKPWKGRQTFDSGAVWKVFRQENNFVFDFASDAVGRDPYKRMRTNGTFTAAEVILNRDLLPEDVWPLEYPADELVITNYLAHHGIGVEVHGCGLIDAEAGGLLFLGHSGAGKSTTTRLWKSLRNPQILRDDRIILRLHDGELWMYGTPWACGAAFASAPSAKLS